MAEQKNQQTQEPKEKSLEKEYIIPLKSETLKVPRYRRAGRAIKTIKAFLAKHMKVPDRDITKIKLDTYLNHEIHARGRKKPPIKIKVKAIKEGDLIKVELAESSERHGFHKAKIERRHKKPETKKPLVPAAAKPDEEKTEEEKKEEKEKAQSGAEAEQKDQEQKSKEQKHTAKEKMKPQAQHRTALSRH